MLINTSELYVGLLDGAPAHISFTKDSITLELFRDPRKAKRHFEEIARVNIGPYFKIVNYGPYAYETLAGKIVLLEKQLTDLKELRRAWWIAEKARWLMQVIRNTYKRMMGKKNG